MIPFVDLEKQYLSIKPEIDAAIARILSTTDFIMGPEVMEFEKKFAQLCTVPYTVSMSNGSDALRIALLALGIRKDDEVITVPLTFMATTEAIISVGAIPVFVDIDPRSYVMDVTAVEKAITKKTKAILPVHLYGQMCDMHALKEIAKKHNLVIIEDAAQAHCAEWQGKQPGGYGDIACFSFYPGKNLGAYGDAGAIVTHDKTLMERCERLRNHGRRGNEKYTHPSMGYNCRMDAIQAAVLNVKMNYIKTWTDMRRKNAQYYSKHLVGIGDLIVPFEHEYAKHVYHLYVIRTKHRDALQEYLKLQGIHTGVHYPLPVHKQPCLGTLNVAFPVAETVSNDVLSLPLFAEITEDQMKCVVDSIKEFFLKMK